MEPDFSPHLNITVEMAEWSQMTPVNKANNLYSYNIRLMLMVWSVKMVLVKKYGENGIFYGNKNNYAHFYSPNR